jgi:anti-sigma B factor antagonist
MPSENMEGLRIVPGGLEDADAVLCLVGDLDYATLARARTRLREFGDGPLVLDLSGLTFTDSTGLAFLLDEQARARRRGTRFRVRGAGGQTLELLERTGVLPLLSSAQGSGGV